MTPEEQARVAIDQTLDRCGWTVQDKTQANLHVAKGVALRELSFKTGEPDYTLFVDGKAIGTVEAKPEGYSLTGVEEQSAKYVVGVPKGLPAWRSPLPFSYETTGKETRFTNHLDPEPRSRDVFAFHRPETLLRLVQQEKQLVQLLREFPSLPKTGLWSAQFNAITNLEKSFAKGHRRHLIQMATGSGKTFTAVNFVYRLLKQTGTNTRVLFLVDRGNLGEQTLKEFQQFEPPDSNNKFTNIYITQQLTGGQLDPSARVVISTIQRLYSMLKGETETAPDLDDMSVEAMESLYKQPVPVTYNPHIPIEFFDFIITDECHRSIYNLWRQVLEYFDASLIGLTATPSKQTYGFFQRNVVMEYPHEKAVADGVNVQGEVYQIKTDITQHGSKVQAGYWVGKMDRQTRQKRWEQLDDDLQYDAADLDRAVQSEDQIRTVLTTFRDKVFTEIFPGRTDLPKTLIFAKDDNHADKIVEIARDVFGKGNDFCKKITYRTTGDTPQAVLKRFRNSFLPRIAVTVDMIATGTDIKPLEIVFFMRSVRSQNFFAQMKGRGVRVVTETEMENVNPGIKRKTRFVIVDAVGVCERDKTDAQPLERQPHVPFDKLLDAIALGNTEPEALESLAGRLIKLERRLDTTLASEVKTAAKGQSLCEIARGILDALDPDLNRQDAKVSYVEPSPSDLGALGDLAVKQSVMPLSGNPDLRNLLKKIQKAADQVIDVVSKDTVLFAGVAPKALQDSQQMAKSFRDYLDTHRAEITALDILYRRPYRQRLTEPMLKELEDKLRHNHAAWTEDRLWDAFAQVTPGKVKGRSQAGRFADLVALVRFALEQQPLLKPFADSVHERFHEWLMDKAKAGVKFTGDQLAWLNLIRDHIATSCSIEEEDFDFTPFSQAGGLGKARQLFPQLPALLEELNEALLQ